MVIFCLYVFWMVLGGGSWCWGIKVHSWCQLKEKVRRNFHSLMFSLEWGDHAFKACIQGSQNSCNRVWVDVGASFFKLVQDLARSKLLEKKLGGIKLFLFLKWNAICKFLFADKLVLGCSLEQQLDMKPSLVCIVFWCKAKFYIQYGLPFTSGPWETSLGWWWEPPLSGAKLNLASITKNLTWLKIWICGKSSFTLGHAAGKRNITWMFF